MLNAEVQSNRARSFQHQHLQHVHHSQQGWPDTPHSQLDLSIPRPDAPRISAHILPWLPLLLHCCLCCYHRCYKIVRNVVLRCFEKGCLFVCSSLCIVNQDVSTAQLVVQVCVQAALANLSHPVHQRDQLTALLALQVHTSHLLLLQVHYCVRSFSPRSIICCVQTWCLLCY